MGQLEDALRSVVSILEELKLPYMLIGGMANLIWGEARTTQDIDITIQVDPPALPDTVTRLTQIFRALPKDPITFVRQTRVLPIVTKNGVRADLIFAELPYQEQAIRRARPVALGDVMVQVCTPEDLIIHKIISERAKDLDDVKGIVRVQGSRLDRAYLDSLVLGLAADLERPEIRQLYLSLWRKPRRRKKS
jgi:predicted nucleotidyltransferase